MYARNLTSGRTIVVSRADGAGTPAVGGTSGLDSISGSGDRIVFSSSGSFSDGANAGKYEVHMRELSTNRTIWVSRPPGGVQNDALAASGSISGDGRVVVFESLSSKLVVPAPPIGAGLYRRDLDAPAATLVVSPPGYSAMQSFSAQLSANGDCVAFTSPDATLAAGGYASPDYQHVYLRAIGDGCLLDDPATPISGPVPPGAPGPGTGDVTRPVITRLASSAKRSAARGRPRVLHSPSRSARPRACGWGPPGSRPERARASSALPPVKVKGKGKPCEREAAPVLVQTVQLSGGAQSISFTGVVGKKRLKPGRYRLVLTATDAAGNTTAQRATVDLRIR